MEYTGTQTAIAKMMVSYYNMVTGTGYRFGNEKNQKAILDALDRVGGDVAKLKDMVKVKAAEMGAPDLVKCFNSIEPDVKIQIDQNPSEVAAQPTSITDTQVQYSMSILEQAVIGLISKTQAERIEADIMGQIQDEVRNFIKNEYGSIERKITTVIDGKKVEIEGVQHEKFETVLKFVANNEPVFLTGPAGSGKNVLCKQVAQALGLKFYFTNAVTQEYKLTGFTDANGHYQPTQFYKAFTEGGVFMLDEMDASIPEVLIILNAAIANRYFDFPAPIGYKEAHPDFRVIAAGNTTGNGADFSYVGRNQLDAASLDRFAVVEIDYSPTIENAVTLGDTELCDFCRAFRKEAAKAGCMVIVSYRGMGRLAKMLNIMTVEEALKTCLIKGLEKDSLQIITNELPQSKYKKALENIIAAA